jgi:hypothetical protein
MIYVWECNKCGSTLKLNYDATEEDYLRIKDCGCKDDGEYEWMENQHDDGTVIW